MEPYLELRLKDGDRVVHTHRGQNIWVNAGKEWLRDLVHYAVTPPTVGEDRRVMYMGFGIGGLRQGSVLAGLPPMSTDYPGVNTQLDIDPSVERLERPVRVTGGVFLAQVSPPVFDVPSSARFTVVLDKTDVSYGSYLAVPLSEIGLFLEGSDIASGTNTLVAYDTFPDIQKTAQFTLEVSWVVSF